MTALSVFVLLSVQTWLGFHGASHIHGVDELEDCFICVMGSQHSAEWIGPPDQWEADAVSFLSAENQVLSPLVSLFATTARGPPAASV